MGLDEVSDAGKLSWSGRLRGLWAGFNRWRKRYWLTRVVILCLLFAPTIGPFLARRDMLVELVRIACRAIQLAGEPSHVHALERYYRSEEVYRLQMALRREIDADRNGTIDSAEEARALAAGLDLNQLNERAFRADLEHLAQAAKRLELVPASYSAREVRRRARHSAVAESRRILEPYHKKIEAAFNEYYSWPDYTKWSTWKRGISMFFSGLLRYCYGYVRPAFPSLVLCFLVTTFVCLTCPRRRRVIGFCTGGLLALATVLVLWQFLAKSQDWRGGTEYTYWLYGVAVICFGAVVGDTAGRVAAPVKRRMRAAFTTTLFAGIILAVWGLTARLLEFCTLLSYGVRAPWEVAAPMDYRPIILGVVLAVIGAACLYVASMRARKQAAGRT